MSRGGLRFSSFVVAVAIALPALAAGPSKADLAKARRLFAEAEADETAERWPVALEKLRRVLAVKETGGVRFHVGLCEDHVGSLVAALGDFRRAAELADEMPPNEREELRAKAIERIEDLEQRTPTVRIQLPKDASGVEVTIGARTLSAAELAAPVRLDPGEVEVDAHRGAKKFAKRLILVERGSYDVPIAFEPDAPPPPPPAPPPVAPPPPPPPGHEHHDASRPITTATWIAGGATIVLAGTAGYFFLAKQSLENDTAAACERHCDLAARQDAIDRDKTFALAFGGAAILGAATTVTLYLTTPKRTETSLVVGPTGVWARGTF